MFAIAWQYLTGKAVASDIADRQAPEWPPHPDRVFQALVAAWGGAGSPSAWEEPLRWLAAQPPPALAAGGGTAVPGPKVYVPVNDLSISVDSSEEIEKKLMNARKKAESKGKDPEAAAAKALQGLVQQGLDLLPNRPARAERFFPATLVHDQTCALIWRDAGVTESVREALAALCRQVTHLGHSSSLVRMWVETAPPAATWEPASASAGIAGSRSLRVPARGRWETLVEAYRAAQAVCAARPGSPVPLPPRAGTVRYAPVSSTTVPRGVFDERWIVLRRIAGDPLHLPQTLIFAKALRDALNGAADAASRPFISGHPAGSSTPSDQPHLAVIPLADVGHDHAHGRVLGFALAVPRTADADAVEGLWRAVMHLANDAGVLRITAGTAGAIDLLVEDRPVPAKTLTTRRWCAPTRDWATVTPFVLDRMPPRRHQHDDMWLHEQISMSCVRQGLPAPVLVRSLGASAFIGAPAARAMPPLLRKDGSRRWHLHVALTFAAPIAGPLMLGAGRYRGYGLCAPLCATTTPDATP